MNLELLAEFCARSEGGECATRTTKKEHAKSIKHMVDKHSRTENMPHIYTFAIIWKLARQSCSLTWLGFLQERAFVWKSDIGGTIFIAWSV